MRTPWRLAITSTLTAPEVDKILDGFNRVLVEGQFEASGLAPAELLALWMAGFTPSALKVGSASARRSTK